MRRTRLLVIGLLTGLAGAFAPAALADDDPDQGKPDAPIGWELKRLEAKPPGTEEKQRWWFGPYLVPPGHDANRVDLEIPTQSGMLVSVEPGMRRVNDISEPSHQEAHIHHAHWFALDPGNEEDNYTYGNTEWIFGNGDEETKAEFFERSAADPEGPVYGQAVTAGNPQVMIYMLHNKTSQPLHVWIVLDVEFIHGTLEQLGALGGREYHDVSGVLFGRTFDVPRKPDGDGVYTTTRDHPRGAIEWTATMDGTIIGTGGHLHPGGQTVIVENMGSKENPCPDDGRGTGGTLLLQSDALTRNDVPFSEDFQMEVSHPAWRAPVHKGDRIRITGVYENKNHAWYTAMTHEGLYVDEMQPPVGRCRPYLINQPTPQGGRWTRVRKRVVKYERRKVRAKRKAARRSAGRGRATRYKKVRVVRTRWVRRKVRGTAIRPWDGIPNRAWGTHIDRVCGEQFDTLPCDRPMPDRGPGMATDTVTIADFLYLPGDYALSGEAGAPPQVEQGTPMKFVNADQVAGIRHSVTTCRWPCNGTYVANYPLADGVWDSSTLGYDPIDGGNPNPIAETPADLPAGRYSYFCRIHPWMRGAFEVVP